MPWVRGGRGRRLRGRAISNAPLVFVLPVAARPWSIMLLARPTGGSDVLLKPPPLPAGSRSGSLVSDKAEDPRPADIAP